MTNDLRVFNVSANKADNKFYNRPKERNFDVFEMSDDSGENDEMFMITTNLKNNRTTVSFRVRTF